MPEAAADVGTWERHLCAPLTGRRVICAFEVLAAMTGTVERLERWGARRPLVLADARGTGPVPSADDADIVLLDPIHYTSLTEQVRARMHPQDRLTPGVVARVDAYDPTGDAVWWVSPVGPNTPLLGRPVLGGRPPHQAALEDKLRIDQLLGLADAPDVPSVVARATYDDLMAGTADVVARADVDQVVWAGDTSGGVNGGGDYIRWVRTTEQAVEAAAFFASRCERVRVSPFLEGVPCSVHGIVLPDGVVVLRPMELANLRNPETGRFVYAGMGTTWDPPAADRDEMRALARRIGLNLQRDHGYRGAFGIDGVLTADGFRVTEMNPRFSGGLSRMNHFAPEVLLDLVHTNALIGRDVAKPAAELEEMAVELLDEHRFVDVIGLSERDVRFDNLEMPVAAGERTLEVAQPSDPVVGVANVGGSPMGAYVRLTLADGVVRPGERCAALSVLLLDFADRQWNTGFGTPLMAPSVRA